MFLNRTLRNRSLFTVGMLIKRFEQVLLHSAVCTTIAYYLLLSWFELTPRRRLGNKVVPTLNGAPYAPQST